MKPDTDKQKVGESMAAAMLSPIHETEELPENSVFHEDNFNPVVLIQLTRLYDVGLALLSVFDPDKAALMAQAHAKGEIFSPPPAWTEDEESDRVQE